MQHPVTFEIGAGTEVCKPCRSSNMLQNKPLVENIGFIKPKTSLEKSRPLGFLLLRRAEPEPTTRLKKPAAGLCAAMRGGCLFLLLDLGLQRHHFLSHFVEPAADLCGEIFDS